VDPIPGPLLCKKSVYLHTRIQTRTDEYMCKATRAQTDSRRNAGAHKHTDAQTGTHADAYRCTNTCTHRYTDIYTETDTKIGKTHIHKHTHTQTQRLAKHTFTDKHTHTHTRGTFLY
jgi:hypothetical protein